ncbi:MAG: valine--tRNA ligase [Rickettsiales bacterium]|jgi:valyl-tRNA synthetase|nr:valine--tRNA ligase [Rickettsiales bacterium]
MELEKRYDFKVCEKKWQEYWQRNKIFKFSGDDKNDDVFSIDTPPPSVSGELHMGHIFGYTQMDIIARMQRMSGKNVFFPIGYDDNGLPSERYVEKKINRKGKTMPRKEFVAICDREIALAEENMRNLFISNSFSFDFDSEYRTISPMARKISQMSFIDLFNKNYAYQREEPVIWDVMDQTSLSQADLEERELESQMNYIDFTLLDKNSGEEEKLEIMTTRPELLPACAAIFCHPDAFEKFRGKEVRTPLGATVPILSDPSVDGEKGTGVMMCCTFGDQADVEKWRKYNLELKIILDERGILNLENIDIDRQYKDALNGLFVEKARKKILDLLEKNGKLSRKPTAIIHAVKVGERSKYPVEIIVKKQWLIKVLGLKDALRALSSQCNWEPKYMEARMQDWVDNLSWDWCISRQRFFGIPIPVWYSKRKGEEGRAIIPDVEQLPVDPTADLPRGYGADEVVGETDVLDTWATSSLTPQLNNRVISDKLFAADRVKNALKLPFDLRFQGHDIIRTWAFDTLVKAHCHQGVLPWKNILINGHCLSENGTKMSKSLGNVIDPVKILKEYGSDATRYWAASSNLGVDANFSTETVKNGQKLVTKLFNAAKFAGAHFKNLDDETMNLEKDLEEKKIFKAIDLWLISEMKILTDEYGERIKKFDYRKALELTEKLFWDCFCDNYLEIVKLRCYGAEGTKYQNIQLSQREKLVIQGEQRSAIKTMRHVFHGILKLFAPFLPVITEELFHSLYGEEFTGGKSIHRRGSLANIGKFKIFEKEKRLTEEALRVVSEIRKYKSERNMSPKDALDVAEVSAAYDLSDFLDDLKNVCNVTDFFFINSNNFKVIIR